MAHLQPMKPLPNLVTVVAAVAVAATAAEPNMVGQVRAVQVWEMYRLAVQEEITLQTAKMVSLHSNLIPVLPKA